MGVTAARKQWMVVKSARITAASVNVSIQTTRASRQPKHVDSHSTRETAIVTTRTTTKVVSSMAATAARNQWMVVKSARITAASVNVSIQTTRASRQPKHVDSHSTREIAIVTTRTTTKVVRTMAATAAPRLWPVVKSARITAASVRASIQTTRTSRQAQYAACPITRETASVTMRTTTKGVSTMEVTAAPNLHRL